MEVHTIRTLTIPQKRGCYWHEAIVVVLIIHVLQELKEKVPSEDNFLELLELEEMDAFKIVQGNLHDSGRGLAEKQAIAVALLVQGCSHPVFLRVLTDMAITWPSFYHPDPENPPVQAAVEAIINLVREI